MSLAGIANALGLTTSAVEQLVEGHATDSVAKLIGVERLSIEGFLRGTSAGGMASAMHCSERAAMELRKKIDMQGAVGIVLGLAAAARAEAGPVDAPVAEQIWMQPDDDVEDIELEDE